MNVLVSGSTGLIGKALVSSLAEAGHNVKRLIRALVLDKESEIRWDPGAGSLETAALEGLDAVVHLAGDNIASDRWTALPSRVRDDRTNPRRRFLVKRCRRTLTVLPRRRQRRTRTLRLCLDVWLPCRPASGRKR